MDSHRKRQQNLHPELTLTGMYNVLEKLRSGQELDDKDRAIHEMGLVSVLREIHRDLDRAVLDAYGWPAELTTEDILYRLVALNEARQSEERRGLVRWLRPEYQARPELGQATLAVDLEAGAVPAAVRRLCLHHCRSVCARFDRRWRKSRSRSPSRRSQARLSVHAGMTWSRFWKRSFLFAR